MTLTKKHEGMQILFLSLFFARVASSFSLPFGSGAAPAHQLPGRPWEQLLLVIAAAADVATSVDAAADVAAGAAPAVADFATSIADVAAGAAPAVADVAAGTAPDAGAALAPRRLRCRAEEGRRAAARASAWPRVSIGTLYLVKQEN